jgi:tetratricopeptide (TPR) repeat protein
MKKFYLLLAFIFTFTVTYSQSIKQMFFIADSLLEYKNYKEAINYYNKILEQNPSNPKAKTRLAKCYYNENDEKKAKTILNEVISNNPNFSESYSVLSTIYFINSNSDSAFLLLNKAFDLKQDTAIYYNIKGIYLQSQDKLDEALDVFKIALTLEPQNSQTLYNISNLYYYAEILDTALNYINSALKIKDKADYYKLRAEIYYKQSRYTDAMFDIDKALTLDKDNEEYLVAKAQIYSTLEQYRDIIRVIKPFADKKYLYDFHYYMIISYYNLGMLDSTIYYINSGHENEPKNDVFYYLESLIYYYSDDFFNSKIALKAAIELNPENAEYYYLITYCQLKINTDTTKLDLNDKFYDINQNNIKNSLKLSKNSKSNYYYPKLLSKFNVDNASLGIDEYFMLYLGSSQQDDFSGYSNSNPEITNAFNNDEYNHCINLGKEFLKEHPTSVQTYFFIANSNYMLGNYNEAIKYLTVYYGFLHGILATGDGLSYETAFVVNSTSDEYVVLKFYELETAGQALEVYEKKNYDVLFYIESRKKNKVYFNIDLFFGKF